VNEFHDPELERLLGRTSGAYPDANVAFEAVRGRVRQVKRRRALVASTATCVLLVGVVALAVRGGGDGSRVAPSDHSITSSVTVESTTPETEVPTPDTAMPADTSVAPTTAATMMTEPGSSASPGGPGPNSSKGSNKGGTSTTTATTTVAAAPEVQPTIPHVDVQWFLTKGGSAGVQLVNGRMVLVGTSSAAGFTAHVNEASSDRIRVEFANGTSTYELQLELSNDAITRSVQHKGA
jgi:hypothetical protein